MSDLSKAISDALDTELGEVDESVDTNKSTDGSTGKEGSDKKSSDKNEEDPDALNEVEVENAKALFKALKSPEHRNTVIEFLAKEAGYKKGDIETKADVKEAKADIISDLKESLGSEFDFLADKIGPAIDKYLDGRLKEAKDEMKNEHASLKSRQDEIELHKLETEAKTAEKNIGAKYYSDGKIPDKVTKEMSKLMDRVPPEDGMTTTEYMNEIFSIASAKLGELPKALKERSDRSRSDLSSNLNGLKRAQAGHTEPDKAMSLKESVAAAIEEASKN